MYKHIKKLQRFRLCNERFIAFLKVTTPEMHLMHLFECYKVNVHSSKIIIQSILSSKVLFMPKYIILSNREQINGGLKLYINLIFTELYYAYRKHDLNHMKGNITINCYVPRTFMFYLCLSKAIFFNLINASQKRLFRRKLIVFTQKRNICFKTL